MEEFAKSARSAWKSRKLSESPWCMGRALALESKGQWFNPQHQQLEKVVYLDENSWTCTKIIKLSFRWLSGQSRRGATMSAVVHLVHIRFPLKTYLKDILSRSTKLTWFFNVFYTRYKSFPVFLISVTSIKKALWVRWLHYIRTTRATTVRPRHHTWARLAAA